MINKVSAKQGTLLQIVYTLYDPIDFFLLFLQLSIANVFV